MENKSLFRNWVFISGVIVFACFFVFPVFAVFNTANAGTLMSYYPFAIIALNTLLPIVWIIFSMIYLLYMLTKSKGVDRKTLIATICLQLTLIVCVLALFYPGFIHELF